MKTVTLLDQLPFAASGCVATIGNFDGVHKGHQQLIVRTINRARELGLPAVAITFKPHPERFFTPDTAPPLLMTLQAKLDALKDMGLDATIVLPFSAALAAMTPEEYVKDILVDTLGVRHLVIGHDYVFGKGRHGNATLLAEYGNRYSFTVEQLPAVRIDNEVVSSTRIRQCLANGSIMLASRLLGRPYCSEGYIVHGKKRGEKLLGFPTANVSFQKNLIIPRTGVYTVQVRLTADPSAPLTEKSAPALRGVANIGYNPTFGDVPLGLEVFLIDFEGDIYDSYIRVYFIKRLRGEQKFSSLEALKHQIATDVAASKSCLLAFES